MLYLFIFAVVVAVFSLIIYVFGPAEPINNKRSLSKPAFSTKKEYYSYIARRYAKFDKLLKEKDLNFGISDYEKRMEFMKDLVSMIQFDMTIFLIMNGVDDPDLLFDVVSLSEKFFDLDRKLGLIALISKLVKDTERVFDGLLYDYNRFKTIYKPFANEESCFDYNEINIKKFNSIFNRLLDNYYSFCHRGTNSGRIHIYLTIIQKLYFYHLTLLGVDVQKATKQAIDVVKISFSLNNYQKKDPSEAFDEFAEIRKNLKLKLKKDILGEKTNKLLEL